MLSIEHIHRIIVHSPPRCTTEPGRLKPGTDSTHPRMKNQGHVNSVWLYARSALSLRDVEEMLAERGLDVSYETVRRWFLKFGTSIAANLRMVDPMPSDHWHLDEMAILIHGERYWLWRAVDDEVEVLDFLVQPRRDTRAAMKLLKKRFQRHGFTPTRIVTEKLRSYRSAFRRLGLTAIHDLGRHANNRAETPHQPVRRRERQQQRFKSPCSAQRFLSIQSATYNTFCHQRHLVRRSRYKKLRGGPVAAWTEASAPT